MLWVRILLSVVLLPFFILFISLASVAGLLGCLLLAMFMLLLAVASFPLLVVQSQMRLVRVVFVVVAVTAGLASRKVVLREVQGSLNRMTIRMEKSGGTVPAARDRLALYGFSVVMGGAGMVVYPEAAREHLLLHRRGPHIRVWESSFPMQAAPVAGHFRECATRLATLRLKKNTLALPEQKITFTYGTDPWRVALALNPVTIRGEAVKDGTDWTINAIAAVPVAYPERCRVTIPIPQVGSLMIEEGLFHALQDAGMLHPYTAEYHWSLKASELLK